MVGRRVDRIGALIAGMPKAEPMVRLEGAIEPELIIALARRNHIALDYPSVAALRRACAVGGLHAWLEIQYVAISVLWTRQDFYDATWAYLERAAADNIVHVELFVEPQAHTRRGIPLADVLGGVAQALDDGRTRLGIGTRLLLRLQSGLGEAASLAVLAEAASFHGQIAGIGLTDLPPDIPPRAFTRLYAECRRRFWRLTAPACGTADDVRETLDVLRPDRLVHGLRCAKDPALIARLAASRLPIALCPLADHKLSAVPELARHKLTSLLHAGLCVALGSDTPVPFGGHLIANFRHAQATLDLSADEVLCLARNGFAASFLSAVEKRRYTRQLETYWHQCAAAFGATPVAVPPFTMRSAAGDRRSHRA
jgi:adenine deaminase